MKTLYLYPLWLRAWHWGNALLILVLMVSGASMHFAGTPWLLEFKTAVLTHNTAGILLSLGWIGFVIGNALTDNQRHYRLEWRGLISRLVAQLHYYGVGIFRNEPHPFQVSEGMKFNVLQQLTYIKFMYVIFPLLIVSGWAFLYVVYLPQSLFGINTTWLVAMMHLTLAYFMVLFLVIHVYIITTGETVVTNLRAMLSGWHREREH